MNNVIVEARYGKMLVNVHDTYVGRSFLKYGEFSEYEVELFKWAIRPGMNVVDVGANIGAHTVVFSELVGNDGKVLAFEPQPHLFHMLCANVALNELRNVSCYQEAIGDGSSVPFAEVDLDQENNMGGLSLPSIKADRRIVTNELDVPCHFLKIDVEGMELEVLRGAAGMIGQCKPMLYVENDWPDKSKALIEFINDLGYKAYWHLAPLYHEKNVRGVEENLWPGVVSINMLCIPAEVEFTGLPEATGGDPWPDGLTSRLKEAA